VVLLNLQVLTFERVPVRSSVQQQQEQAVCHMAQNNRWQRSRSNGQARNSVGLCFLPRDAKLARYMLWPCVRLSLSHAGIVPKRLIKS